MPIRGLIVIAYPWLESSILAEEHIIITVIAITVCLEEVDHQCLGWGRSSLERAKEVCSDRQAYRSLTWTSHQLGVP